MRPFVGLTAAIALLAAQPTAPRFQAVVDLTIGGGANAAEEYEFDEISGLAVDATGRIFVADATMQSVRAYSPDGKFLFKIGRDGSGPGEYKDPRALAFGPDGLLWVRDEGNSRYEAFTVSATGAKYARVASMAHVSRNSHEPILFDPSGNIIEMNSFDEPQAKRYRAIRAIIGANGRTTREDTLDGAPKDSVGLHKVYRENKNGAEVTRSAFYVWQPFGATELTAYGPRGEIARAVSSKYAVSWRAFDGSVIRTIQQNVLGPTLTSAEKASGDSSINRSLTVAKIERREVPFGVPDRKPPIRELRFDSNGNLWVMRSAPADKPRDIDVYDRTGKWIATYEWPVGKQLAYNAVAGDKWVVTWETDRQNDVGRIVRLRFR